MRNTITQSMGHNYNNLQQQEYGDFEARNFMTLYEYNVILVILWIIPCSFRC